MKHSWKLNGQKGFTLLEMLVAVTLIAIGLLATVAMQSVAMNSNSIANRSTVATAIAQEVMEEIMSRPATDPQLKASGITLWPFYDLEPTMLATTDRNEPSAGTYRVIVTTTRPPLGQPPNSPITQVDVNVTRIDVVSNSGLSGVRGSGAGGAFTLTDYRHI